ncbi:unnamed protein product [Hermetia illucens]|uniref:methylated diphthine methylhydrolase n=1 Tax=Hermetia illucens TaxID=343691 RepID=A0A7R8UVX1_HERIL|nr:diphthine methyltransferase [Hermetia illucens]CAD7086873.1 unnamed protein product [Hermetia illucens]
MKITTLHKIDTEYSADSVEWCPQDDYHSYFVCGTYQLEGNNSESTSPPCRRKGRIYLYQFNPETDELTEKFRIETAAILDMKWLPGANVEIPILAAANALGELIIYELVDDTLKEKHVLNLDKSFHNLLTLALDWEWNPVGENRIVASDSKGDISIVEYGSSGLQLVSSWSAHSFEAWTCTFDKWNPNTIFTGGDDTFLYTFDIRAPENVTKISTNKLHLAGVTSVLSHPTKPNILLTGSYDTNLRIFDSRQMGTPLASVTLNGGIWRIRPDVQDRNLLLCACMYENFSIVKISDDNTDMRCIAEYKEHTDICYGADWYQSKENNERMVMATCSFYDKKLCVSSVTEAGEVEE